MTPEPNLSTLVSLSNPVLRSYLFHISVLVLKVLLSVSLIARQRFKKGIFISPEDKVFKGSKVGVADPDIDRCRRAHQNDLENIPFFITAAFVYLCTNPNPWLAQTLFLTYTLSRVAYTLIYAIIVPPQPTRAIVWGVGYSIIIYMAAVGALSFY